MNTVQVVLKDASDDPDTSSVLLNRVITLSADNAWTVRVGRATSTGSGPTEKIDNACFKSRVISREHAYISANPKSGAVTIEDVGSMHGTHLYRHRLQRDQPRDLVQGNVIVFGAAVDRGQRKFMQAFIQNKRLRFKDTFKPIQVQVHWTWVYDQPSSSISIAALPNSFTAPDDLEDDDVYDHGYSDEDVNEENAHSVDPPRRFTVPESDYSDDLVSIISDDSANDHESPSSSPVVLQEEVTLISEKSAQHASDFEGHASQHARQISEEIASPAQRPWLQSQLPNVAALLENEAERLSAVKHAPVSCSHEDDYGVGDEESEGEEVDDFDEIDEFESQDPAPAEPSFSLEVPVVAMSQRDPSPSDAAMVKPTTAMSRAPPFDQQSPPVQDGAEVKPESGLRSDNAWAGHNAVLHEPLPPMMAPMYDAYSPISMPDQAFDHMYQVGYYAPPFAIPPTTPVMPAVLQRQTYPAPRVGRKRKASDMSEIDEAATHEEAAAMLSSATPELASASTAPSDDLATDVEPNVQAPVITVTETVDSIKSPPPAALEPVRKKQKRSTADSGARAPGDGPTFAKLAGTALVGATFGATFGAIGVILALAALPQDFFV
ncbi:uncharacterized protein HMPREF1541_07766 [Cyphellophora europaea CBS 101466]|uniref:FHA domain-containing protein n=1 Tax=Cyphellophora europaea (strain CBS 101466) TaxID=1220924 RepID=W2RNU0_CYPE1|nr:uncharacterized protein HMPREF1541_07766 [Cyphellophora europaea CBS 101466]ETN38142.1 hypothetical protein HMPREF1541_07766 [Cyphellophora europaea CBS 101466]